jgi:Zn-dependent protease with chaperone function
LSLAAIAHESGHLAARDNLKRAALRACRDSLTIFPCGVSLDRAWAAASESAADEHAAKGEGAVALDLASALVKIARLVPEGIKPTMPASALLLGDGADGIAQRVRRLARLATIDNVSSGGSVFDSKAWPWACFAAILISAILLMTSPSTLLAIHHGIEIVVSKLQ